MFRIRSLSQFTVKLVLACLIFSSPAQAVEHEAPNSSHTFLQGGIEHSVSLPPLPEEIQNGKPFAPVESSIKQQDQKYFWYKVAPWMAGTWQTETVAYSQRVPVEKPNDPLSAEHEFLQQIDLAVVKDNSGQYWNCQIMPHFSGPTHQGYIDTYELTRSVQALNPEALKSFVIEIATDPDTHKIVEVNQEEHINVYVQRDPNHLHVQQSLMFFDRTGAPAQRRQALITAHKVAEFRQTSDVSLYQSFVNFMQDEKAAGRH
jgi:hypothetical protein